MVQWKREESLPLPGFLCECECTFHVVDFWVTIPSSGVVGYQRFGGQCCLHVVVVFWVVTPCSDVVGC